MTVEEGKLSGREFIDHTQKFMASAKSELHKALIREAARMAEDVRGELSRTPGPTKQSPHLRPSDPGEVPHFRTTTLRDSISFEDVSEGDDIRFRVGNLKGPASAYAERMEFGWGDRAGRKGPRPYLRPGLHRARPKVLAAVKKAGGRIKT